ncbi:MAG TPA: L-lysine 6-transaminase, partial [Thermoanaerobaculia bacterium]|nr:L-lysine 6-transaminase [Thermoanaerobaculia bacterium]
MSISAITDRRVHIQAGDVHNVLSRHMLADGYEVVMDLPRSKGSWLFDARRGRSVLDFFTNFASCPIGYNHPRLDNPEFRDRIATAAINKPANSDIYTTYMAEFVETFARLAVPPSLNKHMFFIEGGALGVENALKSAMDWKIRKNLRKGIADRGTQIMHLREAFHGRTGYTLSLTNTDPRKTQYFPKFDWPRIDNPKLRFPIDDDVEQREQASLAQAKQFLADRKDEIAAFIMEPVQGEGGDNHFRPEYFRAIRQLCDENDMLLIFDEVQSGVGLTGKMWAFQHYGIEPDMICFGKKTQVCGCLVGPLVDREPENVFKVSSRINSTWGGSLVDMVRAARYLEIIEAERLVDNARVVGDHLLLGLRGLEKELGGLVTNARGRGLMIAF